MNKLKIIKFIVFIMTFLLVFGSLFVLGSLFHKTHSSPLEREYSLKQPTGSTIDKIVANDTNLYILVKDGGLPDRILIFDTRKQNPLTSINLN